ncbi:uncharacterized protein PGTG_04408 [Puccinia graminis f. sp. tritici CRL 75-36-700-3]|uniref:Uncharacterized protein n=1 Tax=Puccinia graminis f. sp. tritici (strain CRL 75-36-700-3 / race SCCL) TaxID=418459 RepID=E3K283_PUCGT|nr:uncharacterized protein PGTG_04408 [Puccinia graminis f. sp. tritici CRL 75-36-700-3]EFP78452.2 hypothetical protein PGTG_04408 [Puccinia graminis f. sp. tritici CRL 75-36-700-3]
MIRSVLHWFILVMRLFGWWASCGGSRSYVLALEATGSRSSHYSYHELLSDGTSFVDRPSQRLSCQESSTPTESVPFPLNSEGQRYRETGKRKQIADTEEMSSQSMRATREDGTWPGPSGSSTTGPADRTQLFKPKPIRTAERRFSKTIKKISLANPKSRGSAFAEYGPSLSQPEKDRSNSPIILDSQDDMLNSQHTPQEFIQPDTTTHDAPTADKPIGIKNPREDQEPARSQPPVVPQIVVPSSKDPQKHLDAGESQPSIIPPAVKPVKEKTKKHQRPKKVKKLVLLSELISPSVEPPSIAPSSVEPPSIASSSVEPPSIAPSSVEPPSIAPPSVVLPPIVRPSIAPPPVVRPSVAPQSVVPPSVAPPCAAVGCATVDCAVVNGPAVYGAAVYGAAVDCAVVNCPAVYGAAVYGAAVYGAAVYGAAVYGAAVYGAVVNRAAFLYCSAIYSTAIFDANKQKFE